MHLHSVAAAECVISRRGSLLKLQVWQCTYSLFGNSVCESDGLSNALRTQSRRTEETHITSLATASDLLLCLSSTPCAFLAHLELNRTYTLFLQWSHRTAQNIVGVVLSSSGVVSWPVEVVTRPGRKWAPLRNTRPAGSPRAALASSTL